MKILILSDLHLELSDTVWDFPQSQGLCDIVIVAGDIHCTPVKSLETLVSFYDRGLISIDTHTVWVPGNHEFYGIERSIDEEIQAAKSRICPYRIHLLSMDSLVIGHIRFLGTTLWTDYQLFGNQPLAMWNARRGLNDHRRIQKGNFTPSDALLRHQSEKDWLFKELGHPFDGKTVVITHHCPSPLSVPSRFKDDPITPAFSSDLSNLVIDSNADLWVHGHTHNNFDYTLGNTRVICNPKGYGPFSNQQSENKQFNERLIIDL